MRRRNLLILLVGLALAAIALAPVSGAYSGGVDSGTEEYGCTGGCHGTASTAVVTTAASDLSPTPGGEVKIWVNVSGGEASGSQLGVMIVSDTTSTGSLPSDDGWTILEDTTGGTYNYNEIESYPGSASFSWRLSAPATVGPYTLYAKVVNGGGGTYSVTTPGIAFTVSEEAVDGDGDDVGTDVPTLTITYPSNAATVRGNITIKASVVSVDEITSATLRIDGTVMGELTSPPFEWTVNTTSLSEGGHVIVVTVEDATGDKVSKEIGVFVDNENELISTLEWVVTMGAGVVAIVCASGMAIILALYVRRRIVERGSR